MAGFGNIIKNISHFPFIPHFYQRGGFLPAKDLIYLNDAVGNFYAPFLPTSTSSEL